MAMAYPGCPASGEGGDQAGAPRGPALAVGDQVMALRRPSRGGGDGECSHREGDIGCVTSVDARTCYITWERTGRASRHDATRWSRELRRVLEVEDRVQAVPRESYIVDGTEHFGEGDVGTVMRKDGEKYYVLWARTLKTTGIPRSSWHEYCERVLLLQVGDRVRALPARSLAVAGQEYYREGDVGHVQRADSQTCHIMWERTQQTSVVQQSRWAKLCRRFGKVKARLRMFNAFDLDDSGAVSRAEWRAVFARMDANRDGTVTRKEWQLLDEETALFDAIPRRFMAQISCEEWESAFRTLDADDSGFITMDEWFPQRLRPSAGGGASAVVPGAGDAAASVVGAALAGALAATEDASVDAVIGGPRRCRASTACSIGVDQDLDMGDNVSTRARLRSQSSRLPQDAVAARPHWLPARGPGNSALAPELWGLTLGQWAACTVACLLGQGGDARQADGVDWHAVGRACISPWTQGAPDSGVAVLLNGAAPLKAEAFVVHAWDESALEAVVAVLGRAFASGLTLDTAVWFDAFSRYQPQRNGGGGAAADRVPQVFSAQPLHGAIVAHTARADVYGRLWCLHEMHEASRLRCPLLAAASMEYLAEALAASPACARGLGGFADVDAESATCTSSEDERMLRGALEQGSGYHAVNERVAQFKRRELTAMGNAAEAFLAWERQLKERHGLRNQLSYLADNVQSAGVLVAVHCLRRLCAGAPEPDPDYEAQVLQWARASVEDLVQADVFAPERAAPPFLRQTPGCADALGDLEPLLEEDDLPEDGRPSVCLDDLRNLEVLIALLELPAGGRQPSR